MEINLNNVEELLFFDKKVHKLLPEFSHLFNQWTLARQVPALRSLGKRSVLDLLNSLSQIHVELLSKYFGVTVTVDKLDYHLVKNYEFTVNNAEEELFKLKGMQNLALYREGEHLYISFWR